MISISKAATLLGLNKTTLIRWDLNGQFQADHKDISGARYYNKERILLHAKWFDLCRKDRKHRSELNLVLQEKNKFINIIPLEVQKVPNKLDLEAFRNAYDNFNKWQKEYKAIMQEYRNFPKEKIEISLPSNSSFTHEKQ